MEVIPISAVLGAEVRGLGEFDDLSDDERFDLGTAWRRYHLLLFRDREVAPAEQTSLCRNFGPLLREEYYAPTALGARVDGPDQHYVGMFTNEAGVRGSARLLFHSDLSQTEAPVAGISLYALEIPKSGTSTFFVNAELAWSTLPSTLVEQLKDKSAIHSLEVTRPTTDKPARFNEAKAEKQRADHPVRFLNPQNGEAVLFMTEMMTECIQGLPAESSLSLLDKTFEHLYSPSHQYEHRWRLHDLLVWNNVSLQHARRDETGTGARTLRRVVFSTSQWIAATQAFLDEAVQRGLHKY